MVDVSEIPVHQRGLVNFGLLLPTPQLVRILWSEFEVADPNAPKILRRRDYLNQFSKWYGKQERQRRVWMNNLHSGKDTYRDDYIHPRIRRKVESIPEGKIILDIGCGTCEAVAPYLKDSQFYAGVDSSVLILEYAAQKFGIPFLDGSGHGEEIENRILRLGALPASMPIDQEGTDAHDELLCSMVLHHVRDLETSLESMFNLLKAGGQYFIMTFNSDRRADIDGFFEKITYQDETKTIGDYNLQQGRLRGIELYFHTRDDLRKKLRARSYAVSSEVVGDIFTVFEGIKK